MHQDNPAPVQTQCIASLRHALITGKQNEKKVTAIIMAHQCRQTHETEIYRMKYLHTIRNQNRSLRRDILMMLRSDTVNTVCTRQILHKQLEETVLIP